MKGQAGGRDISGGRWEEGGWGHEAVRGRSGMEGSRVGRQGKRDHGPETVRGRDNRG